MGFARAVVADDEQAAIVLGLGVLELRECVPVAILGASQKIHTDALPLFAGKRVRIFGHDDEAGSSAVARWAAQLASVGVDVDAFSFAGLVQVDGKPVKDLNDALLMDVASFARVERMLP